MLLKQTNEWIVCACACVCAQRHECEGQSSTLVVSLQGLFNLYFETGSFPVLEFAK